LNRILVDTSGWIAFFRGEGQAVSRIDPLLADGRVAITGPISAEVLSGARSRKEFDLLKRLLEGLEWLPEPSDLWEKVVEQRFALARKGFQASLIDLTIALSALEAGDALMTRDRGFSKIQDLVPFELDLF